MKRDKLVNWFHLGQMHAQRQPCSLGTDRGKRASDRIDMFYRYFERHCSREARGIVPVPLRRVRNTRCSTHSHPFQVSLPNPRTLSHKS